MPETQRLLKVFLCHASADKPKVRDLYRYLRRRGIQPWFDEENLIGGQDWQVEIPKALSTSDAIIICLTQNAVDKEGYVQKEIKFALDKALEMPEGRIYLIPVRLEECEVPYSLRRYQWVDVFEPNGFSRLMRSLKTRASQLERLAVQVPETEESKPALTPTLNRAAGVDSASREEHQTAEPVSRETVATDVQGLRPKLPRQTITAMIVAAATISMLIIATLNFPLFASPFRPEVTSSPEIAGSATDAGPHTTIGALEPLLKAAVSPEPVRAVAFSPDGARLAVAGEDKLIYIFDANDANEILRLEGHTDVVTSVTWSPDGARLASGSDDQTVWIWDAVTGEPVSSFEGHTTYVSSVTWSHDGKLIASSGPGAEVIVWEVATGKKLWEMTNAVYGNSVAWSPNDTMLAISGNQRVLVLDPNNSSKLKDLFGDWGDINGIDWSPDGQYLAAAGYDHRVHVWQVSNWNELVLEGHTDNVPDVAWSNDSRLVASVSYDGTVRIWNVAENKEIRQLANPAGALTLDWSRDGKSLAGGGEVAKVGYIEIWDATQFDE